MRKSFIKKTVAILLVVTTSFVYFSCQQDEIVINPVESESVIDYDVTQSPSEMTAADSLLADQAFQIMDSYVFLEKDGYVLTAVNGASIGLSERVFDHYKTILDQTNEMLKGAVLIPLGGKSVEVRKPGYTPKETHAGGGVTKVVYNSWPKFDLYLSNGALQRLAAGYSFAGIFAGLAPQPVLTNIIHYAKGFCSCSFSMLAINYPDGIIISCVYKLLPPGVCVSYSITSQ